MSLRPVTDADRPFLLELYASTREEELAPVPWTHEEKRAFVEMQFSAQDHAYRQYERTTFDVVEAGGEPAGRLYVARREQEIRIVDIALLPAHRGRGIGTALLRDLIAEAAAAEKPLTIAVERTNRALTLYHRLGFQQTEDQGIYLLMELRPGT